MNSTFGRRALMGGAVGAAATAASVAAAGSSHAGALGHNPSPGFWNTRSKLNRSDRVFLNRGLMHGAWVRHDNDGWFPNSKLWKGSGFTTPHFYKESTGASADHTLDYGTGVMRGPGSDTWALARAPFGENLNGTLPDPNADWLTPKMRANVRNLYTVCFGDEENYSAALTTFVAAATAKLHDDFPWVLAHTNQTIGQYLDPDMIRYVQEAKPDLLTWDWYPWQRSNTYAGGSVSGVYRQLERYRRISQAGVDGTGTSPLAFGQYTTGFRLQPPGDFEVVRYQRRKHISESQINLLAYTTWAMGGKWLSLFRWELDEPYTPWETDGLFLTDENENPLPAYHRYARLNADMRAFSPTSPACEPERSAASVASPRPVEPRQPSPACRPGPQPSTRSRASSRSRRSTSARPTAATAATSSSAPSASCRTCLPVRTAASSPIARRRVPSWSSTGWRSTTPTRSTPTAPAATASTRARPSP